MRTLILTLASLLLASSVAAQEELLNLLNEDKKPETILTTSTFKSSRILNGHSVENTRPGNLDFRISHRFGRLNSGAYEFWGLDQANIHLSFEYGITKWLMAGIGRGNYEKTFDGFLKATVLKQSSGAKVMPVSLSLFSSAALKTIKTSEESQTNYLDSRLAYSGQLLIARKFTPGFSAQIAPSYVHKNLDAENPDPSDLFAFGAGGRLKLTKRISLNAEYFYLVNPQTYNYQEVYSPFSMGFDIETGGHVFQLIFTNSVAMIEKGFIGETTGQWSKGDVHFGFNIARTFTVKKH